MTDEDAPSDVDEATGTELPEPTAQAEALRRQQYYVGTGGGILSGFALMALVSQQFPSVPLVVVLLIGLIGAGFVLWLVSKSVFPGEQELADSS